MAWDTACLTTVLTDWREHKNLSYKIISGIMLAMGILVTLLMLVFYYSSNFLESKLLENRNLAELQRLIHELSKNPDYELPQTTALKIYQSGDDKGPVPTYFEKLPDGFHGEVDIDEDTYFVLVSELNGRLIYIASDISSFENVENMTEIITISSWLIMMALIFAISYLLSRYLVKPISDFAEEIDQLTPGHGELKFSGRYHGLEIEKITRSFDRYLKKQDEYIDKQQSFAAMASHELRTPLTVVQTSADLISQRSSDSLVQTQCGKINRSISDMTDMILALLSITREQPLQEKSGNIPLLEIVNDSLEKFSNDIRLQQITINKQIKEDILIHANSSLLAVVVNNLLSNAIKHSPQQNIDIDFRDNTLIISDQGSGLDTDNIERLFEFGTGGKLNGGYGLGLYITKLICDKQGWTLTLRNASPGTTACVTFLPTPDNRL
jgi:signal transduction histidine kinase